MPPCPIKPCCGGCTLCVNANDACTSAGVVGLFTVTQGGTTIGSCTTSSLGKCCVTIPASGSYDWTFAASTYPTLSGSVNVTCPGGASVTIHPFKTSFATQCIGPSACDNASFAATGDLTFAVTGVGSTSTVVNVGGFFEMCIVVPSPGTYNWTLTSASGRLNQSSGSFTSTCSVPANLNGNMTPASAYACLPPVGGPRCFYPWKTTLNLTDSVYGSCTLTYNSISTTWIGTILGATFCGPTVPPGQTIDITYRLISNTTINMSSVLSGGGAGPSASASISSLSCPFTGGATIIAPFQWSCGTSPPINATVTVSE